MYFLITTMELSICAAAPNLQYLRTLSLVVVVSLAIKSQFSTKI